MINTYSKNLDELNYNQSICVYNAIEFANNGKLKENENRSFDKWKEIVLDFIYDDFNLTSIELDDLSNLLLDENNVLAFIYNKKWGKVELEINITSNSFYNWLHSPEGQNVLGYGLEQLGLIDKIFETFNNKNIHFDNEQRTTIITNIFENTIRDFSNFHFYVDKLNELSDEELIEITNKELKMDILILSDNSIWFANKDY
jgi:hypothetical protein